MTERVVTTNPDERDVRPGGAEEARRVRVAAVVGDLEHLGAQAVAIAEHERLGEHLRVAGEQHPTVGMVEPQHERGLVEVGADTARTRRREDGEDRRPHAEPVPGGERRDRHAAIAGHRVRLVGRGARALVERVRTDEQRADGRAPQHRGQAAGVVVVRMGEHDRVEPTHPPLVEVPEHGTRVGAAVDEEPGVGVGAARRDLDEHRVALADVEHRDGERAERRGGHERG